LPTDGLTLNTETEFDDVKSVKILYLDIIDKMVLLQGKDLIPVIDKWKAGPCASHLISVVSAYPLRFDNGDQLNHPNIPSVTTTVFNNRDQTVCNHR